MGLRILVAAFRSYQRRQRVALGLTIAIVILLLWARRRHDQAWPERLPGGWDQTLMERSALALGADRMPVRQSGKQTLATQTSMP